MMNYLRDRISNTPAKLITYADYMGAVLYHSQLGYYMKEKQKIGRQGDFITTSNVSDIFGSMVAKWVAAITQNNNLLPAVFCEVGAGNGRFAKAFLQEWKDSVKRPLKYIIVESSPYHRKVQRELLTPDFLFEQVTSLDELAPIEGIIFSNELFDALPVHVIEQEQGQLDEVMVGIQNDQLYEEKVPLTNEKIVQFLQENHFILNEGQRIEVPLLSGDMLEKISDKLFKGFVITVDYGYTHDEWMEPSRKNGSLRGFYHHEMVENVLLYPGDMDITAHVHFDWLIKRGEQLQLNFMLKLRQDEFLLKMGILSELTNHYDPNPFSTISKRNRAIRSLIMPSGMSSSFHVLMQQKGIHLEPTELFPMKTEMDHLQ